VKFHTQQLAVEVKFTMSHCRKILSQQLVTSTIVDCHPANIGWPKN